MITRIEVTCDDIENGVPCVPDRCVLSLAIARHVAKRWVVQHNEIPSIAQRFKTDFDAGRPVKPFSFLLNIPDDVLYRQSDTPRLKPGACS